MSRDDARLRKRPNSCRSASAPPSVGANEPGSCDVFGRPGEARSEGHNDEHRSNRSIMLLPSQFEEATSAVASVHIQVTFALLCCMHNASNQ